MKRVPSVAPGPLCLLLLLSFLPACQRPTPWAVPRSSPDTLRTLRSGQVVGGEGRYGSHAWLGIPFARPPVGERRWKKPEPPEAWSGVKEALTFSSACAQPGSFLSGARDGQPIGSEDCLYLNVWAPRFTPAEVPAGKARLPVMVWIHGGGNSIGTADFFEGGHLAAEQRVVLVTVQYRLGPFGWFRHPGLREGADLLDASGNFGTLDLVRSLEWVRDNAAAFGGDPDNVTVFGESAGGLDVYTLLLSPLARGLFHRAVVESGGLWGSPLEAGEGFVADSPEAHVNSSSEVLARAMVKTGEAKDATDARRQLASRPAKALAEWMRGLPAATLLESYTGGRAGMLDAPLVFHDGTVLPPGDWLERLATPGGWNQVPVVVGSNHDEMKLFLFLDPRRVHRLLGLFPRLVDPPSYLATAEVMSRFWKLNGVDRPLEAMAKSGATELYAYRWDWRDEPTVAGADLSVMLGAAHGLEVPFVFGHFALGPLSRIFTEENAADREAISSAMRQYWAELARGGRPGRGTSGTLPEWRAFGPPADTQLVLDTPAHGGVRMGGEVERADAILQSLFSDARLEPKERCRVLHDVVVWGRGVSRSDYEATAACQGFHFEAFATR